MPEPNVLVGYDGSDAARVAVATARQLAGGGQLEVLHVYRMPAEFHYYEFFEDLRNACVEVAREVVDTARELAGDQATSTTFEIAEGNASAVLCKRSAQNVGYLVVGTRGHGPLALGSTSARVLAHAECPVVVVPEATGSEGSRGLEHVLVLVDGSSHSKAALAEAIALAKQHGSKLTLLTVVPAPADLLFGTREVPYDIESTCEKIEAEQLRMLEGLAGEVAGHGVECQTKTLRGSAADEIVGEIDRGHYDLVALGSRGRGALKSLLLGSVSHRVAEQSTTPVLVVRAR